MRNGFAWVVVAAISCLLFANLGLSQSSNATLSGTVSDSAKALIPGVTISATNTDTAVVTTGITNESGTYSVSGLLPGVYKVTAELPGFDAIVYRRSIGQRGAGPVELHASSRKPQYDG